MLGLYQVTAILLYRAERLQEKGQLQQALKYYQQVLQKYPDCVEASENARMTEVMIRDQTKPSSSVPLGKIPENSSTTPTTTYTTTEMEILLTDCENTQISICMDPVGAAFRAAEQHIEKSGHGHSLLKLIKNDTIGDLCTDHEVTGCALFQVTLIYGPPAEATKMPPEEATKCHQK